MMLHDIGDGSTARNPTAWTTERKKPKGKEAKVGAYGTAAQLIPGDEVEIWNRDGSRVYHAFVAWIYTDGAAQIRIGDPVARELRSIPATARIRWLKVRPK